MREAWTARLTEGGAGLPLPLVFSAVVEDLLDHGDSDRAGLTAVIKKAISFKEEKVLSEWDSWDQFTWDILAQLRSTALVEEYGLTSPMYRLTPWFTPGVRQIVIPDQKEPGNPMKGMGFTVFDKTMREKRNRDSKALMDLRTLITKHPDIDPQAVLCLEEAAKILSEEITVSSVPQQRPKRRETREWRSRSQPVERTGKRGPHGTPNKSDFFRTFWENAKPGEWFTISEIADTWNDLYPQWPVSSSDALGSMRKIARTFVDQGILVTRMKVVNAGTVVTSAGNIRKLNVQTAEYCKVLS